MNEIIRCIAFYVYPVLHVRIIWYIFAKPPATRHFCLGDIPYSNNYEEVVATGHWVVLVFGRKNFIRIY